MHTLNEGKRSDRGRGMHKSANVLLLYYQVRKGLRCSPQAPAPFSFSFLDGNAKSSSVSSRRRGPARSHWAGHYLPGSLSWCPQGGRKRRRHTRRERPLPGAERAIQHSALRLVPQRKPQKAKERKGKTCQHERRERPQQVASGAIQRPVSQPLKVNETT